MRELGFGQLIVADGPSGHIGLPITRRPNWWKSLAGTHKTQGFWRARRYTSSKESRPDSGVRPRWAKPSEYSSRSTFSCAMEVSLYRARQKRILGAMQLPEPELLALSARELSHLLGISERHLWTLHSSGRLGPQPIYLGRATRWPAAEVSRWIALGAPSRDEWQAMRESPASTAL